MARSTEPSCRQCRRERTKLFLKGARCSTPKCALDRRPYPPGDHGQRRSKVKDYGLQLREKQKLRRTYGVLERQFRRYYRIASRHADKTGDVLLRLLETRLDNVVYRMGFAASRAQARQLVRHGHILVNDRRVNIPSCAVRAGDTVAVREKSRTVLPIQEAVRSATVESVPEWMEVDHERMVGKVLKEPSRDQITTPVQEGLVVELYSR